MGPYFWKTNRVVLCVRESDYASGRYMPHAAQHEKCTDTDRFVEMQGEMSGLLVGKVV
jgi:hypothetical protein